LIDPRSHVAAHNTKQRAVSKTRQCSGNGHAHRRPSALTKHPISCAGEDVRRESGGNKDGKLQPGWSGLAAWLFRHLRAVWYCSHVGGPHLLFCSSTSPECSPCWGAASWPRRPQWSYPRQSPNSQQRYAQPFFSSIGPVLSSGKALRLTARSLRQCGRAQCSHAMSGVPRRETVDLCLQVTLVHGTPPPCASTLKVINTAVTRAPMLRQARACARRAVPKERMSPETCPYLTLSTIVATGHYNTMCRQISASSGGPHCPSGPSGAVE
jgi:hypothetical protein